MGIKFVPAHYVLSCDSCPNGLTRDSNNSLPLGWYQFYAVHYDQKAQRRERSILSCPECSQRVLASISKETGIELWKNTDTAG